MTQTRTYICDYRSLADGEFTSSIDAELFLSGYVAGSTLYTADRGRQRAIITAEEAVHDFILTIPGVSLEA